jgi:class 3 adenylate cyclase/tetratricopeptide (TPR) repeat protein
MKCERCQHENRPGAKFCEECAAPVARACAKCGAQLSPTAKFCSDCAHPAGQIATSTAPRFGAPETYTPRHLAEKILTSKSALEGERKQVTVLFADLKGSMELLADRDPEEARKLLDPVLEHMMEAVHRYEGTVNQVMGDGIMALFGAPLAHEDHGVRACYAALDMQAAIRRYADEVWRAHGVKATIRVGLNSGEVVVRAIGSDLHLDYTAVGQTTHLAARMEQLATPGTVLLTADTLRLTEGYVTVKPLGPVPVKGLAATLEVYELTGAGPLRSRLHAAAARGLTRFVGREGELDQLRQALGRAAAGHGQVVALVGEPGVGKSRLVWEVTHSHRVHGWLVLQAGSVSYGKATSYLPVIDLLRGYVAIDDRDGPRAVREKVTGKILTLDRALEGSLPALLSLLDVPADDPQWQALDPAQRGRRTLDAIKRLLLRECQVQPLLVVFEDLHWIDPETQALLDSLVESLPTARLLLVVNYRPEYQQGWWSKTYYTQLRLDPLPPETAEQLLEALLGSDAGFEPLKRALIQRTEGNPFFLEESVRALAETGALLGERGAYQLGQPLLAIQVPVTVQAVLAARIDRLPLGDKAILQMASVVGKDVPFALLQAIAQQPEEHLLEAIGRLQAAEFLYEAGLFPNLEYTFKHALTHDVTYGSLLQERRRALHARVAEAIEALYRDRLDEQIERLAHHAFRGEAWGKALGYLRAVADKAGTRGALREAVSCLEQGLVAVGHLPETHSTLEQAIDLRLDLQHALFPLGEGDRLFERTREAVRLAEALGDQRRLGSACRLMSLYFRVVGQQEPAIEWGQRALDIAASLGELALQAGSAFALSVAYHAVGDYARAAELLRRNAESLAGDPVREAGMPVPLSLVSRAYLMWCLAELGEFAEGYMRGAEAVKMAEALEQQVEQQQAFIFAYRGVGYLHLLKGDLDQAIPLLERSLQLCRALDLPGYLPWAASRLGYAYALGGRVAEGLPLLEQTVERTGSTGMVGHSMRLVCLGEGYLMAGRPDAAMERAGQALDLSIRQKEWGSQAYACHLLGQIASHGDPPDLAGSEARFRHAMALANERGMRPLVAHCHLGLGRLYHRTGDRPKAQEYLAAAATMYREMGMTLWLGQAQAEIRVLV